MKVGTAGTEQTF